MCSVVVPNTFSLDFGGGEKLHHRGTPILKVLRFVVGETHLKSVAEETVTPLIF